MGKEYSANAVQQRLQPTQVITAEKQAQKQEQKPLQEISSKLQIPAVQNLLKELVAPEGQGNIAYELREDVRRKRKRKRLNQ